MTSEKTSDKIGAGALPPIAWRVVGALAAAKLALHLFTIEGYGIFRDELYYLACAEHLDWGYVDHPALSILVLWIVEGLFGSSLLALRIVPALAGTATVVLVAVTARTLGGGRTAQALAATAALTVPVYMALNHYYSMNALGLLLWATAMLLLARLARGEGRREWLWLALVLALGLANKIDFLWLGAGLAAALVLGAERRWLATRWPWLTGALAMVGLAPYAAWQAAHGWPTLEFMESAREGKMVEISPVDFLLRQIDTMGPWTFPIWLAGLLFLFFHRRGRRFQLLGWVFVIVAAILVVSGSSRGSYLAPAFTALFAAGGVAVESFFSRWRARWPAWAVAALLLIGGAVGAPFGLPILPVESYIRHAEALGVTPSTSENKDLAALPQFYADMHGWREIADTVAGVVDSLPEAERESARIFAPDYGVAGAIDHFGPERGLAPALSGHNNYWLWGPGDFDGRVLVSIGGRQEDLEALFERVERAATIDCGLCMPYENGRPVWVCRGFRGDVAGGDFSQAWRQIKHFD